MEVGQQRSNFAVVRSGTKRPRGEGGQSRGSRSSPGGQARSRRRAVPGDVALEFAAAGGARDAAHLQTRLADAARAYERDRYEDARAILRELVSRAPGVGAIHELYGLTFYRLGRWKDAIRELRAFADLSGSVDQFPVIADCERALGHHERVASLFDELRRTGAGSDVLTEGRLVMAGSLADRGRVGDAIALLEQGPTRPVRKPLDRHIRQWYALADLYERSGDVPRARALFTQVVKADPELSDAAERLSALA